MAARQAPEPGVRYLLDLFVNTDLEHDVRAGALNDPSIPISIVHCFIRSLAPEVRDVALTLTSRSSVLAEWAAIGTVVERTVVAFNPYTPQAALRRLAADPEASVRMQLPFNPATPPDVLAQLVLDSSPEVQDALAVAFDTDAGHALRRGQRSAERDRESDGHV